jgi:hypothetical protein
VDGEVLRARANAAAVAAALGAGTACFATIDESKLASYYAATDAGGAPADAARPDEDGATACGACDCAPQTECKYAVENGANVDVESGARATIFGGPGALAVRCHDRATCDVYLGTGSSTVDCAAGSRCNVFGGGGQSTTTCAGDATCDVECHEGPCSLSCDTATCVAHRLGAGATTCTGATASCP